MRLISIGNMKMKIKKVKFRILTPIWTGDAERKNTALRETGVIGSLRWWHEALIRGLGGTACDPTNTNCDGKNHCDACELFGCTGWARKFRLEVEKFNSENSELRFIEIREMRDIEWALLNMTITIIEEYGAIGGKIAESSNGLIKISKNNLDKYIIDKSQINDYLKRKGSNAQNPNISRFIFINSNLNYSLVKEIKNKFNYLKGQPNKAKRYFYKTYQKKPNRFFVYSESDKEYKEIEKFLKNKKAQFIEGIRLLEGLK